MADHRTSGEREPLLDTASTTAGNGATLSESGEADQCIAERNEPTLWRAIANFEVKTQVAAVMFCFLVLGMIITAVGVCSGNVALWHCSC